MPNSDPHALRRRIDRLDRRIARVELQVATVIGAASELERAGLFERASTEQLVAELWLMVDRLKALRDGWVELHACLSGERVTPLRPQGRELLH